MKRLISLFVIIICIVIVFIASIQIGKIKDNMILSVFSNSTNNIDFFIHNIENVLLSTYEEKITNPKLTNFQKEYIAKMYILRNRAMFQGNIKQVENSNYVDTSTFNLAYNFLFGESYISDNNENIINLGNLNVERFSFDSRKVLSYENIDDMFVVNIEYNSKFNNNDFSYRVEYNIGYKGGMYFLIGFTINKIGDE